MYHLRSTYKNRLDFPFNEFIFFSEYSVLLRTNLPNLCPNMIHVDALDFNECHSEEVMFLLTLSVL